MFSINSMTNVNIGGEGVSILWIHLVPPHIRGNRAFKKCRNYQIILVDIIVDALATHPGLQFLPGFNQGLLGSVGLHASLSFQSMNSRNFCYTVIPAVQEL